MRLNANGDGYFLIDKEDILENSHNNDTTISHIIENQSKFYLKKINIKDKISNNYLKINDNINMLELNAQNKSKNK